jgi:hypothetical protein
MNDYNKLYYKLENVAVKDREYFFEMSVAVKK